MGRHVRERPAPTSKRFVTDGVLTGPRTVIRPDLGLVEQTAFRQLKGVNDENFNLTSEYRYRTSPPTSSPTRVVAVSFRWIIDLRRNTSFPPAWKTPMPPPNGLPLMPPVLVSTPPVSSSRENSAGGNLAAVVCQQAKTGGPKIALQVLFSERDATRPNS